MVRKALDIPANYYLQRGYSKNILDKYDIGLCNNPNKEMFDRIVVPVYDQQHSRMVGCSGRSIHEKCQKCSYYHNPNTDCVGNEYGWKYSKWKHNKDFKSKDQLYNLWFSKEYILKTGIAVIVESPGNVWRLEEAGIKNSVAIFGTSLSDRQKMLLDCSGAMSLLVLLDSDEAGQLGTKQIYDKCHRTYNVKTLSILTNDIADMDVDTVKRTIIPEMEKIHV
jgi:DNA primase